MSHLLQNPKTTAKKFLLVIVKFFNKCWTKGCIPSAWKEAVVVPVQKPGKPADLTSSYRGIALICHFGKLYESVVGNRLVQELETKEIIPRCQAGFRKNRNCMEHVVHLVEEAKKIKSQNRSLAATFFDIKKAFDTVWHGKLLDKMKKLGFSGNLYNFVKAFLTERMIEVKVGSATSTKHTLDMGVPQGSVIAPILFTLMLHDIETAVNDPNFTLSLFADDLAIWRAIVNRKKWCEKAYQPMIDKIAK